MLNQPFITNMMRAIVLTHQRAESLRWLATRDVWWFYTYAHELLHWPGLGLACMLLPHWALIHGEEWLAQLVLALNLHQHVQEDKEEESGSCQHDKHQPGNKRRAVVEFRRTRCWHRIGVTWEHLVNLPQSFYMRYFQFFNQNVKSLRNCWWEKKNRGDTKSVWIANKISCPSQFLLHHTFRVTPLAFFKYSPNFTFLKPRQ